MNFEVARHHMIEQQLRPWEVLDPAIISVLYADRREDFVPAAYRNLAFADFAVPLGGNAQMLPPKLEAHALQALALKPHERVLEIGTGSGHMAALLAACAKEVWSIEIDPLLAQQARANLARAGITKVHVETADGLAGLPARAPFDAIMLSGAVQEIPAPLIDQLAPGGRMLAFVGASPLIVMRRLTRHGPDAIEVEDLMETVVPPLKEPPRARFVF